MIRNFMTAAALGAAIFAPAAHAADENAPHRMVSYADLDLSTESGVKQLDARVERAARSVCKVHERVTGSMLVPQDRVECYEAAKKSAKSQLAAAAESAHRGG